jgi:hypothetical protein
MGELNDDHSANTYLEERPSISAPNARRHMLDTAIPAAQYALALDRRLGVCDQADVADRCTTCDNIRSAGSG